MDRTSSRFWSLALLLTACDEGDATPASAESGDAALGSAETADAGCFTPTENRHLATFGSDRGCPCEETPITRSGFCVWDDATPDDFKPFICYAGRWITGADGPCFPPALISTADCQRRSGEELGDVTNANLRAPDAMPCPDDRTFLGVVNLGDHVAACCKRR